MAWSTSLKGLHAARLARALGGGVERPRVAFSLAAIDAWQRSVVRRASEARTNEARANEAGTWVGEVPPGLWGRAPAPALVALDVGAARVLADEAAPEHIAFHTSIADAAHRSQPSNEEGD